MEIRAQQLSSSPTLIRHRSDGKEGQGGSHSSDLEHVVIRVIRVNE